MAFLGGIHNVAPPGFTDLSDALATLPRLRGRVASAGTREPRYRLPRAAIYRCLT
jgi:hypothetical protein